MAENNAADRKMNHDRYQRQMILPEIGISGQKALEDAKIFVVGAGGLGSALLPWLVGAGIGQITLMDHDRVEESNLHRQTLYRTSDIGRYKAQAAKNHLLAMNPQITIHAVTQFLAPDNAANYVRDADIIIDAADSLAVTYTLSDLCMVYKKPFISSSVIQWSGYVGAFCLDGPSYRAVFPEMPQQTQSCSTSGVIGTAVATLGSLQAQMSLSYLLKIDPSPMHNLIRYNAKTLQFSKFSFSKAKEPKKVIPFIGLSQITDQDIVIELRSIEETTQAITANAMRVSVPNVVSLSLPTDRRIVLCCRSGIRAAKAASLLGEKGYAHFALMAAG